MYIKKVKIFNFRNYEEEMIDLEKEINIFYGNNAQGKTNIVEAIYLCSLGKSFRAVQEKEMINKEKNKAIIEIEYEKKDRKGKIKVEIQDNKNIFVNDIKIKKTSEILGNINVVLFTPDDIEIIKKGPEKRRRFLNILISQLRPKYIYTLNQYNKVLEQRNSYLKQLRQKSVNEELLISWNERLIELGWIIYKYRKEFIENIKKEIGSIHEKITKEKEKIEIQYISDCSNKEEYSKKLKEKIKEDIIRGHTTKGIHRDDFIMKINNEEIGIYGSQGQQRTAMLSLKLSELKVIYEDIGECPVLLLDDFMSELDKERRKRFLENINGHQVVITCTDKEEGQRIYYVENGKAIIKK